MADRPDRGRRGNPQARRWYKRARWHKGLRPAQLAREPICRQCKALGRVNDGSLTGDGARQTDPKRRRLVVDHIVPHRGDPALFWDPANLQTLCPDHHDRDKQREDLRGYSERRGDDGWPVDPAHPANR